jgi:hypothetical protein
VIEVLIMTEFEAWWNGLSAEAQEDVAFVVGLLESKGVGLGFPHSSAIRGSRVRLRELRARSGGQALRVLYAFDPWRSAVLLIGGSKAGREERFYAEMVPKAERLYQEYLTRRRKEGTRR